MQRRRALRVGSRRSLVLTALLALAGVALALPAATAADAMCSVATCKLDNNSDCTRSSGKCPVCVQYVSFFFFDFYRCTDPSSRTGACSSGATMCPAPTPAPTPPPRPKPVPVTASPPAPPLVLATTSASATATTTAPSPSPGPTTKPTTAPGASSTTSPTPTSNPNKSNSTTSSPLGAVKSANFTSSDDTTDNEAKLESGVLKPSSAAAPNPESNVESTGGDSSSSSAASTSSSITVIFIVAGAMIALVAAVVLGKRYVARRHDDFRDDSEISLSGKHFGAVVGGHRETTAADFSESALDLNATPSTSKFAYMPAERSTNTTSGAGTASFGGADIPVNSHRTTASQGAAETGVLFKSDAMWRRSTSHHSFRGSQHVNMSFVSDNPLTASQLSTSSSPRGLTTSQLSTSGPSAHESHDVFPTLESPEGSEWLSSGYLDRDGGHNSGDTEFYSSKISEISDDDHFTHRSSEKVTDESTAKWKQKFYVEL